MKKSLSLCFLLYCFSFTLFAESFVIDNYNIRVDVDKQGRLHVQEIILVNFSEKRRGIFKSVPTQFKLANKKHRLHISNVSVKDWKFNSSIKNGSWLLRIGDPNIYIDGKQEYHINYTIDGAILNFDTHEEVYLDLIGDQWDTKIRQISYEVNFPPDEKLKFNDYHVYNGSYGTNRRDVTIIKDDHTLKGKSTRVFEPNEMLSIGVRLHKGYFQIPASARTTVEPKSFTDWKFPLPLVIFLGLLGWWRKRKNSFGLLDDSALEFYPPEEHNPAEIGILIDDKAHDRDLLSLIPYWGNQKYLKVNSISTHEDDLIIEKLKPISTDAKDYEKVLFNGIFQESDFVPMTSLKEKIFKTLNESKQMLRSSVYKTRYYDAHYKKTFKSGSMIICALISLAFAILAFVSAHILTGLGFIALFILCLIIRFSKPKKSDLGKSLEQRIQSFKQFLQEDNVEHTSAIINKDPKYFDKMYPYAIALDLTQAMMEKFNRYDMPAPNWYHTDRNYSSNSDIMADFSNTYDVKSIQSAFTSTPPSQSSGGSGSSGGGFAGGGVGGGGGGSW